MHPFLVAMFGILGAAEGAVVGLSDKVTLHVCSPPHVERMQMPDDYVDWEFHRRKEVPSALAIFATFPGSIEGRRFQLLEGIVTDSGTYRFELAPTMAFEVVGEPIAKDLSFAYSAEANNLGNVKFEFTYSTSTPTSTSMCPDEKFIYTVDGAEVLKQKATQVQEDADGIQ